MQHGMGTQKVLWHTHEPNFTNTDDFFIVALIRPIDLKTHKAMEDGRYEWPTMIAMQICKLYWKVTLKTPRFLDLKSV